MNRIIRNVLVSILVLVIICSTLIVAGATTVPFGVTSVSGSYHYLASSIKTSSTTAAVAYINYLQGGNLVHLRGGTSATSAYTYSAKSGDTVNMTLKAPFTTVGDNISLYGYGLSGTTAAAGTWNPN